MGYSAIKSFIYTFIICYLINPISAQETNNVYINHVYDKNIKSITIANGVNVEFPVIQLGELNQLNISFDDLSADYKDLYVTLVHCNIDWKESTLSPTLYLNDLNEDRINDLRSSINTSQKYTHYNFQFPSKNLSPKISGNYILKVYKNGDSDQLLFCRKIYVIQPLSNIEATVNPSFINSQKNSIQRLEVKVNTKEIITNPHRDLKVVILQNFREDNKKSSSTPSLISNSSFIYNSSNMFDFPGNNEFNTVDLRSLRANSTSIDSIDRYNKLAYITPYTLAQNNQYQFAQDNNGKFFIRNTNSNNSEVESDYIYVIFKYRTPKLEDNVFFVQGLFNSYDLNYPMIYDTKEQSYIANIKLKQGVYDYIFSCNKPNNFSVNSYYKTENDYQIFVYYRRPNSIIDELIGFKQINSIRDNINKRNRE